MVTIGAKSAAARLLDDDTAEIRFLTVDNEPVSVILPQGTLYNLAKGIANLRKPRITH